MCAAEKLLRVAVLLPVNLGGRSVAVHPTLENTKVNHVGRSLWVYDGLCIYLQYCVSDSSTILNQQALRFEDHGFPMWLIISLDHEHA